MGTRAWAKAGVPGTASLRRAKPPSGAAAAIEHLGQVITAGDAQGCVPSRVGVGLPLERQLEGACTRHLPSQHATHQVRNSHAQCSFGSQGAGFGH